MTHFDFASGLDAATKWRVEKDFDQLRNEFSAILDPDTVERCLERSMSALAGASVPNFVPLLAHRFARQQLVAVAQHRGLMDKALPEVLFVDIRDSGRSQIAAALLAAKAPGLGPRNPAALTRRPDLQQQRNSHGSAQARAWPSATPHRAPRHPGSRRRHHRRRPRRMRQLE